MSKANTHVDAKRFVELVQLSETVDKATLKEVLSACDKSVRKDSQLLADHFVEEGLLTRWQCNHLLSGKHRGFQIGSYQVKRKIGRGGMSTVYLGEHAVMKREAAIKVLPRKRVEESSYLERFHREAEAVASFDHPNIVRIFDVSADGDIHYIAMEYIRGQDLQRLVVKNGPLDFDLAADYIAQSALGLQHAHDRGFVHRDIKPANLLANEKGIVKVLDMGLAKFTRDETDPSISGKHKENALGTVDYLPPEQATDSHTVDHRADIYGLGCTLYFLLVGHAPFPEGTMAERISKHLREKPTPLLEERPGIPMGMVSLCNRMMAKDPDHRPQSAMAVAEELEEFLMDRGKSITSSSDSGTGSSIGLDAPSLGALSARWKAGESTKISGSLDDTRKSVEVNIPDNLQLAPLEDGEDDPESPPADSAPDDQKSDATEAPAKAVVDVDRLEKKLQPLADVEEEIMVADMTPAESTYIPPSQREEEGPPVWLWPVVIVAGLALLGLIFLIAT